MPSTWSDWVALIGAVVGTVTGVWGLVLGTIALRRDAAQIKLRLETKLGLPMTLRLEFPRLEFVGDENDDEASNYAIVTITNVGNRPIKIVQTQLVQQRSDGRIARLLLSRDTMLNDDNRRISFAQRLLPATGDLVGAIVMDDSLRTHLIAAEGKVRLLRKISRSGILEPPKTGGR